ncbi:hypothetical protein B0H16DRAFT_1482858 [Mycena metata]|uniref:Uncharacterized protein n=1 Tax=Mycena metata TaxID=1033252 RepID=A0AAD7M6I0_9AGAR|nr:hypothetical protein B0H16DRAFT_1482858 [Mycena metata]
MEYSSSCTLSQSKENTRSSQGLAIHRGCSPQENDEKTAVSLFTVALEGFTYTDSRAECMIRVGNIAKKNGDLFEALELWETARPLFECSSQAKRLQDIDERIGGISEEVKQQHRESLARFELNAPARMVEEVGSDIEELELEEEQVELSAA